MFSDRKIFHRYLYIFSLTVLGVMLPWSMFIMSVAQFILIGNWILEGDFKNKLNILKKRKSIIAFIGIILVHFIWIFNTSDIDYALHDIKIKIPILVLSLIVGTTPLLTKKEFHIILNFFIASIFTASMLSVAVYLGYTKFEYTGYRSLSVFVSHIRFSLMIVMTIVISFYLSKQCYKPKVKLLYILLIIWLTIFLFFLQSYTGIVIIIVILLTFFFMKLFSLKNNIHKGIMLTIFISLVTISSIWLNKSYKRYHMIGVENLSNLKKYSPTHVYYFSDTTKTLKENGNLVYIHILNKELKKAWKKASDIEYDSLDKKGNALKYTLLRYLASKGLTKDSVGFSKLSKQDIINIENGMPNYLFENKFSLYVIFYKLIWEYEAMINNKDINNKSILQRIEYFKTGKEIFTDNYLLGVGTGDIQQKFDEYYIKNNSELTLKNRHRTHNQFLTFLITFGILGFAIILIGFLYPLYFEKDKEKLLLSFFLIIVFLSFLNEDTLETQAGVTFFAYFYTILVFAYKKQNINSINKL